MGLAMIAAILEKAGHDVLIADLGITAESEEGVARHVINNGPSLVGISSTTPSILSAAKIARNVKAASPNVHIILGGAHASTLPEQTMEMMPDIDIIVRGEGEATVVELVDALERERPLEQVKGIVFRDKGRKVWTEGRDPISDLDQLPFPAYHLLPIKGYRFHPPLGRKHPVVPIITSRGCPFRCTFCTKSVFGQTYRSNSAKYVSKEIEYVIGRFQAREIKFYDDSFTLQRRRVIELCDELVKREIDVPWSCETRVDLVDEELLRVMKGAGCYMIEYGVESGNEGILEKMKKGISRQQVTKAFEATRAVGIQTVAYFMLGYPGETWDTARETIEFAKRIQPDFVQFSVATPFPGTEFHELCREDKMKEDDWSRYVYADISGNQNALKLGTLIQGDAREFVRTAYVQFYLRWGYVWRRLASVKDVQDARVGLRGLAMLCKMLGRPYLKSIFRGASSKTQL